jgi:hypothetical protein
MTDVKVLIGIPSGSRFISCRVIEDLFGSTKGVDSDLKILYGYEVDVSRNKLCREALDGGYSHVFFVDSDVRLPENALENLLSWNEDVVLGYYAHHGQAEWDGKTSSLCKPGQTGFLEKYDASEISNLVNHGRRLVEIAGGGMGCALISAKVLETVEEPWFHYRDRRSGDLSEDYWFCAQCRLEGFRIFADLRVACKHGVEHWESV